MILEEGFAWNGQTFGSLSLIAKAMTGTNWNGHRFFGLRRERLPQQMSARIERAEIGPPPVARMARRVERAAMKDQAIRRSLRSAIYTRVSTEQGLEQDFNSLDAQREACEAYIKSQAHEGWRPVRDRYDDGGFSGGSMVRPGAAEAPH